MSELDYRVASLRFNLLESNTLVILGTYQNDNPQKRELHIYLDDLELELNTSIEEGPQVRKKYLGLHQNIHQEILVSVKLPESWTGYKKLRIEDHVQASRTEVFQMEVKRLKKLEKELPANLEFARVEDDRIVLVGWAMDVHPVKMQVLVDGKQVDNQVTWSYRQDVLGDFKEIEDGHEAGYEVSIPLCQVRQLKLQFESKDKKNEFRISGKKLGSANAGIAEPSLSAKAWGYFKKYGLTKTVHKTFMRLSGKKSMGDYEEFRKKYGTTEEELTRQRNDKLSYEPLFSIVIPLYKTNHDFLQELLASVQNQTYGNWELCLADGSGAEDNLQEFIKEYRCKDNRIKYLLLEENLGIAGNTNAALTMATGDYMVLADHDDLIALDALYECARAINEDKNIDVLYTDEDKVDWKGKNYFEPHFKSDYNIDLLCSMNYICHMFVFGKKVYEQVGGFESIYDGAQDHDFILRCVECAEKVHHIPKVLYHWRCHTQSTSSNPESKLYAFENGCKAVEAHYKRIGVPASVEQGPYYGMYRSRYHWKEEPLLSIIIPNKDHVEDLDKCIKSILNRSTYKNYEFIIVENNSTEAATFAYYKELEKLERMNVLYYEGEFNYSKINNYGAANANGEYFLLLNNDTEMIEPDGIAEMMDVGRREDVGIVGARLFFADNTIQHAGVIVGFGGMAGHAFIGQDREDNGYFSRILCAQDMSAVTAACLLVKKECFMAVKGLTEEFRVAFNDIDFCLKVRALGKLVVYNPYAIFYHYESKSRGQENSSQKIERFNSEAAMLAERWKDIMTKGDPYYNPNLTLDKADFSLKE